MEIHQPGESLDPSEYVSSLNTLVGDVTLAAGANITLTPLGTTITIASVGGTANLVVGSSTITDGTDTRILFNNSGVLGEYTLTGTGTVVAMQTAPTFSTSITGSYLTASEIVITNGSKQIISAPVATYPSLTELSYVKGVTSAIQTQLGTKQATITFGTGVQTALGVNIGSAGAPVLFDGAGGTPSSLTGTNITGTASGLTAGTVTTNANLTGVVTSVGNATAIADAALSIAKTSGLQTALDAKALGATTITIAGTANQITSSAGAQDLSANRTWTLSLPADVIIPTVLTVPNTGLHLLDTNASHDLIIKPGSNITADRTFTLTTGDTDMIVDFTAVTDEYVLAYDVATNTWRGVEVTASITGSDTQVLFFDGANSPAGDAGFTYDKTSNIATLGGLVTADIHTVDANSATTISIIAGDAVSGDNAGGGLSFSTGDGFGSGTGGTYSLSLGAGGDTGDGGAFELNAGAGGATSGAGGYVSITAGGGQAGNANGGAVYISAGTKDGSGANGELRLSQEDSVYNFKGASVKGILNFASLTTTDKTFTFPDTTGTIALTSSTVAVATATTIANEATDTSCFINFTTAATGNLGIKSNTNMTFNSNTGVATFASTILTSTDINGGTIDGVTIGGASAGAGTFTTISGTTITASTGFALGDTDYVGITSNERFVFNTAGTIVVTGADLRLGETAGTDTTSVVSVGGTQTLTNKTLTSPTLTTPALGTPASGVGTNITGLVPGNLVAGTLAAKINLGEGADPATIGLEFDASMSADERYSGHTIPGTAGATLAFGDLCYLDVTAGEWLLADADAASTSGTVMLGICVDASTDGNATSMLVLGSVRSAAFPSSIALGAPVYVSTTAGDITATQPSGTDDVIRIVGYAITVEPNTIWFNPENDFITHT